ARPGNKAVKPASGWRGALRAPCPAPLPPPDQRDQQQRRKVDPVRRRTIGRHQPSAYLPARLAARLLRAAAEAHVADLHLLAERDDGDAGLLQPLAAVAGVAELHADCLANLVAFDVGAFDDEPEALAVAQPTGDLEDLRRRDHGVRRGDPV